MGSQRGIRGRALSQAAFNVRPMHLADIGFEAERMALERKWTSMIRPLEFANDPKRTLLISRDAEPSVRPLVAPSKRPRTLMTTALKPCSNSAISEVAV